jgi:hypothetical protein
MSQSLLDVDRGPPRFELPDDVRDPRVRMLFNYWQSKCGNGRLPGRKDIDPMEMHPFLPCVIMFDVERHNGHWRFRYRLVGTEAADLFGADATGRYLSETNTPEGYEQTHARLTSIVETKQPVYTILPVAWPNRDSSYYEGLTLPMATDGQTVDLLLGVRCGLTGENAPAPRTLWGIRGESP